MEYAALEDRQLWSKIAQGDEGAFSYVYANYSESIYKYGHKFTQESGLIEDVIQDVFVHLWESRTRFTIQKSIKFYLLSSFRRELFKRLQANQQSESLEDYHSNVSWQESIEEILLENQIVLESSAKINRAMDSLSIRQKEAIYLRYIQELSYEDISILMDIQVPSLYNLIFKGIKNMREFLVASKFTTKTIILFILFVF